VKHSMAAVDKLCMAGFSPAGSLTGGLADTVDFFRRKAGWRIR